MKHFFFIALVFITAVCQGQEIKVQEIKDIEIDFKNKDIDPIETLETGDYYRIVVKNINLNLWAVSLKAKDTILDTKLQTPAFEDIPLVDDLSTLIANLTDVTSSLQSGAIRQKSSPFTALMVTSSPVVNRTIADPDEKIVVARLNQEKTTLEDLLTDLSNGQNDIKDKIEQLKYDVGKKQLSAFDENNVITTNFDISQTLAAIQAIRNSIDILYASIRQKKDQYEAFSKSYRATISKNEDYVKADKERKKAYYTYIDAVTSLKELISTKKSINWLKSVLFIRDKNGTYTSMPIQFKGDQAKVTVTFTPREPEFNLESYEMPFVFPVQSDAYWSVGVSFYGSTLYDERFSSLGTTVDSTQTYTIVRENEKRFEIGTATLLRFGKKFGAKKNVGFHGSIGPGISIAKKIKPRVLLGGGFSFGKKHSISVDFGGIIGYVERKSNVFDEGVTYTTLPENITVSELQFGGFIAVGYLFRF